MSIYDVLERDHQGVLTILGQVRRARDADERYALFAELRDELLAHAKAEEHVLYRRLKEDPELRPLVEESFRDHATLEALLARLDDLEPERAAFDQRLQELEAAIQRHVDDEEDELFPAARGFLGDDADSDLEGEFLGRKQELLERGLDPTP